MSRSVLYYRTALAVLVLPAAVELYIESYLVTLKYLLAGSVLTTPVAFPLFRKCPVFITCNKVTIALNVMIFRFS